MTADNVIKFRPRALTHWGIDGNVHAGSISQCSLWECHEHSSDTPPPIVA